MLKKLVFQAAAIAAATLITTAAYAEQLKGAIVVMDLSTNAFQIEMANQAVDYGK